MIGRRIGGGFSLAVGCALWDATTHPLEVNLVRLHNATLRVLHRPDHAGERGGSDLPRVTARTWTQHSTVTARSQHGTATNGTPASYSDLPRVVASTVTALSPHGRRTVTARTWTQHSTVTARSQHGTATNGTPASYSARSQHGCPPGAKWPSWSPRACASC